MALYSVCISDDWNHWAMITTLVIFSLAILTSLINSAMIFYESLSTPKVTEKSAIVANPRITVEVKTSTDVNTMTNVKMATDVKIDKEAVKPVVK